jgi:phage terminase large subunit-like protein
MALQAGPKRRDVAPLPPPAPVVEWWQSATGRELYPWQARALTELHGPGRPRIAYAQMPRKEGKTHWAAALALTEACLKSRRHVYAVSDSERNLRAALFREMVDVIGEAPGLRDALHIYQARIEVPETGSFIEMRPNKFAASQSINPHLVLFDEVHLQRSADTWHGMQMAGAAREDFLLAGVTTPGYDMTSIAHELYLRALQGDDDLWSLIFEAAAGRDIDDRDGWREANPIIDRPGFLAALEHDRRTMPEHEFRRFRLGQWTATADAWLPYGSWAACHEKGAGPEGLRLVLGFDGSLRRDATALVGATVEPQPFVFVVKVWERPPHAHHSWRVPRREVTETVVDACERWQVCELVADRNLWADELEDWAQAGVPVVEFPQSPSRMRPATARFYEAVTSKRMRHDGDLVLARHLDATIMRPNGMVAKENPDSPRKIDAAVAAIMAYDRAASLGNVPPRPPVFVVTT